MSAIHQVLAGYGAASLDADAAAYIAALITAGATVTGGQQSAIDTFVIAEKAASRWTLHKRIFLPIWAAEAPNEICLKSLSVGSFAGGMTHAAGYAQGNGSDGYFDSLSTPVNEGAVLGDSSIWRLALEAHTVNATALDGYSGSGATLSMYIGQTNSTTAALALGTTSSITASATDDRVGIQFGSSVTTQSIYLAKRNAAGWSVIGTDTNASVAELPSVKYFAHARNNNNAGILNPSDAKLGGYGYGRKLTEAQSEAFTLNLKTLWETCTGLALP